MGRSRFAGIVAKKRYRSEEGRVGDGNCVGGGKVGTSGHRARAWSAGAISIRPAKGWDLRDADIVERRVERRDEGRNKRD
jgi:hypothetical protein